MTWGREQLSHEEQRIYQSGLAELEAEEMGAHPADDEWQALRAQWVELAARHRELARLIPYYLIRHDPE